MQRKETTQSSPKVKTITLLITLLVIVLTIFAPDNGWQRVGIYAHASLSCRMLYPFFHVNIIHVAFNAWCLLSVVFIYRITLAQLILAYFVSTTVPVDTLAQLFPSLCQPTVGLSAIVFFLFATISFQVQRWCYYQSWMVVYLAAGFFFPATNAVLHLYAYTIGFLFAMINKPFKRKTV